MNTTIVGPVREPSPCCWDGGCIHCRERARERARVQFLERARLRQRTDPERATLGLLPRRFGTRSAVNAERGTRATRHASPVTVLGNSVLPSNFQLA